MTFLSTRTSDYRGGGGGGGTGLKTVFVSVCGDLQTFSASLFYNIVHLPLVNVANCVQKAFGGFLVNETCLVMIQCYI